MCTCDFLFGRVFICVCIYCQCLPACNCNTVLFSHLLKLTQASLWCSFRPLRLLQDYSGLEQGYTHGAGETLVLIGWSSCELLLFIGCVTLHQHTRCTSGTELLRQLHLKGFQPAWCISTIYHAWDTPFWSGTLDMLTHWHRTYLTQSQTVNWHQANQFWHCAYNARLLAE